MDIEARKVWLRLKFSVAIFIFVLAGGTFGFWFFEDNVTTLLDSFFFTLVTVTTIGYGNIFLSNPGEYKYDAFGSNIQIKLGYCFCVLADSNHLNTGEPVF